MFIRTEKGERPFVSEPVSKTYGLQIDYSEKSQSVRAKVSLDQQQNKKLMKINITYDEQ